MTAHIVRVDWAADCSRLVVLRGQRSCLQTAARPTDNECSSVGRTPLSDTGVGDELTVVGQVTRGGGVVGQGQVFEVQCFGLDTGPRLFFYLFIALSVIRCSKSAQ